MKNVAKAVVVCLVLGQVALVSGCARRCGEPMPCKVERMERVTCPK